MKGTTTIKWKTAAYNDADKAIFEYYYLAKIHNKLLERHKDL